LEGNSNKDKSEKYSDILLETVQMDRATLFISNKISV